MTYPLDRRSFLKTIGLATTSAWALTNRPCLAETPKLLFKISLGEYSLHRALAAQELDHLDFAKVTQDVYGLDAVEFWSSPFGGQETKDSYLADLNKRSADHGVTNLLILVDGEGNLGDPDETKRLQAVENHKKWLMAAKTLDCHSIRVNAQSKGSTEEQLKLAADGLRRLSELGAEYQLNVIVENHGGLSSNGTWLRAVMDQVNLPNCGTLPDFGNFHDYDRYLGVTETMPYAKAVSAKSHDFDDRGNETKTDYLKMMKIVLDAGYHGYVGIEYEGKNRPEKEGILLTKALLERVRTEIAAR